MPAPIVAAAGIGLAGAAMQTSAARKAAGAQTKAAKDQIAYQEQTRDMIMERMDPFYRSGLSGQEAYLYELGLGPRPTVGGTPLEITEFTEPVPGSSNPLNFLGTLQTGGGKDRTGYRVGDRTFYDRAEAEAYASANPTGGTPYAGFTATPGYQFQLEEGLGAVNALAGARGGLDSGRTRQDLTRFGSGLAAQEYGTFLNRLAGLTDQGMSAAGMQAGAATNAAAGVSNALANRGNAQAAGYIGQANAWGRGIGNTMGLLNYQNSLAGGNANIFSTPWAASGFWG